MQLRTGLAGSHRDSEDGVGSELGLGPAPLVLAAVELLRGGGGQVGCGARGVGREVPGAGCQVWGAGWCEVVSVGGRTWTILSSMACWAAGSMPMSAGAISLMMLSTAFITPLPMYAVCSGRAGGGDSVESSRTG